MGKFWALLFGGTMAGCFGLCVVAYFVHDWWLPDQASAQAVPIDHLFNVIWLIVGFFFVLTEALLCAFLYRYGTQSDGTPAKPGPSAVAGLLKPLTSLFDEQHKIEIAWSIVPAAILLFISFYQLETWMQVKFQSHFPETAKVGTPVVVEVSARQFEWRMRYPNRKRMEEFFKVKLDSKEDSRDYMSFSRIPQFSDVHVVNELHMYKGYPVLVHLGSRDVIHGFNLPHMRVRQDALPGKIIPVWFIPNKANTVKKDGKWVDGYDGPRIEKFAKAQSQVRELQKKYDSAPEAKLKGELEKAQIDLTEAQKELESSHDSRNIWELACSQLCGWGHFRMVGRVYVHESQADFLDWLESEEKAQNKRD